MHLKSASYDCSESWATNRIEDVCNEIIRMIQRNVFYEIGLTVLPIVWWLEVTKARGHGIVFPAQTYYVSLVCRLTN